MLSFLLKFLMPAALAFAGGAYLAHRVDAAAVARLELRMAEEGRDAARDKARALAAEAATERKEQQISLDRALGEARAQARVVRETRIVTEEIPTHVPSDACRCIPLGLVRLLDAAATGRDPAALSLAPGQSDRTCAPLDAARLAAGIVENYGAARANAEQLNALEAWLAAEQAAHGDDGR